MHIKTFWIFSFVKTVFPGVNNFNWVLTCIEIGSITQVLNQIMGYELFEWGTKLYQNHRPNTLDEHWSDRKAN